MLRARSIASNNTLEFWKNDIATDVWTQDEDVLTGGDKKVKAGGALTHTFGIVGGTGHPYALSGYYQAGSYRLQATRFKPASGIHLLKLETQNATTTAKLTIE